MQKRHTDREMYFEEQSCTASQYYWPYLQQFGITKPRKVLEIGCGEGGNLLPFAQAGCEVYGMDLCDQRIRQAEQFFRKRGLRSHLWVGDAVTYEWGDERFDLILLHDVIEHVADKECLLRQMHALLAPEGVAFVGFPAWQMPFGGHQQIARSRLSFCPWIHLLPARIYKKLLEYCGETEGTIRELLAIKKTRCTIEHFQDLVHRSNFQVVQHTLFLINPHYHTKFGLRPIALPGFMARLPWIRNFYCSGTFYLLQAVGSGSTSFKLGKSE